MEPLAKLYRDHQGKVSDKWSFYLDEYDRLFPGYRTQSINFLEIGIQNGGSLEIWSKYFPNAACLIGCDINPDCEKLRYEDSRVKLVIGDANTDQCEKAILGHAGAFDLILDDGSHRSGDIIRSFVRYFRHLNDGGIFVVEDMHCSYWQEFEGGLFDFTSSMAFFKLLADVINREHWGVPKSVETLLSAVAKRYSVEFDEHILSHIHSITFLNSMCVIEKRSPERNVLGARTIAGQTEAVVQGHHTLRDGRNSALDQSASLLSNDFEELRQKIATLEHEKHAVEQANVLLRHSKESAEHEKRLLQRALDALQDEKGRLEEQIQTVLNSTSWRITKPLRVLATWLKRITSCD
jgi:predicted O-methyltransferase YrrM